jgi:hypothetical protein
MKMYRVSESCITKYPETTKEFYIPLDELNRDYQQFIQDVAEQGIEIVGGPSTLEFSYSDLRSQEYPSLLEQEDMKYWDEINGTTVWRDTITAIKERYPKTITGGTTIGEVPDWVQEAADNWTFNKQLREYVDAVERLNLDPVVASEDIPETVEVSTVDPVTSEVTTESVRNPLIVEDERDRTLAQEIIDNTPATVIEAVESL